MDEQDKQVKTDESKNKDKDNIKPKPKPKGKVGMPPGKVQEKTIEKRVAMEVFRERVRKDLDALYFAQRSLAFGCTFIYEIVYSTTKRKEKKRENILVTDPEIIKQVLDEIGDGSEGTVDEKFYFVTTEKPDNKAIDSLLDRAYGKALQRQSLEDPDGGMLKVGVVMLPTREPKQVTKPKDENTLETIPKTSGGTG